MPYHTQPRCVNLGAQRAIFSCRIANRIGLLNSAVTGAVSYTERPGSTGTERGAWISTESLCRVHFRCATPYVREKDYRTQIASLDTFARISK